MWLPWAKTRLSSPPPPPPRACPSPPLPQGPPGPAPLQPRRPLALPAATAHRALLPSVRIFHRVRVAASALRALRTLHAPPAEAERRVVLYFTSLHVVRATYEDCRAVRAILRGLRASVDERDLAMDPRYLQELAVLLPRARRVALPQVFVGGRHLGGADEVRSLHESGELRCVVAGPGAGATSLTACGRCGGERYVLCGSCNGSHKRYSLKGGGGFRACAGCNENGLVRCPDCSPPAV